ncbi:hypothetical protein [Halomonas garicola]|uniref:hypothetical protein n=1 Tax=Halomonas garicola TaxID=1690008 RepID=UPI00289F8486|nr:hypothetical protein [Halomonas garicola]
MQKVRRAADVVAGLEGLMWLGLGWSISLSAWLGRNEPILAAVLLAGTVMLFSWVHRPLRFLLRRFRVRKRRTDMWMHLLVLPLLLAMAFHLIIDAVLGDTWLPPKMLLVNVLASAGWLTFLLTLFIKYVIHDVKRKRARKHSAKNEAADSHHDPSAS